VEEGYDAAVRIGHSPDSSLVTKRLGETKIITCTCSKYLAKLDRPKNPAQLEEQSCVIDLNARDPFNWPYRVADRDITVRVESACVSRVPKAAFGLRASNVASLASLCRHDRTSLRLLCADFGSLRA
jgi:hypothetical protein